MIGTPFVTQDEIHNRKIEHLDKKPWEQEARDDQGRKHFYGAFTGALRESSVGYKGTVGSKEGFQPKTFVSSRRDRDISKKTDDGVIEQAATKQDILEFMDEEDLGEHHIAGSALIKPAQTGLVQSGLDLTGVQSVRTTCGKKGREIFIGMQTKGAVSQEIDDQEDSSEGESIIQQKRDEKLAEKLDRYGLGYVPTRQDLEMHRLQKEKVQANRLPGRNTQESKNSKVIKMAEFNEDDQDVEDEEDGEHMAQIYSRNSLNELKKNDQFVEMQTNYINLTNQKVQQCRFVVGGILKSQVTPVDARQTGLISIRPPPGYNPYSEAQKRNKEPKKKQEIQKGSKLDAFSRSKLLEGVDGQTKSKLPDDLLNLIPFCMDKDKLLRFEAHYMEYQGQLIVFDIPNNMMTGSQMRRERDEFNQILNDFKDIQKKKQLSYQVYTSKDKKGNGPSLTVKMEAFDWQPDRLLILRFGLQNLVAKRTVSEAKPAISKEGEAYRRPISFKKAGASDISGDDYFNKIMQQFGKSNQGQEEVKSEHSNFEESGTDSQDAAETLKDQEEGATTQYQSLAASEAKKALFDSIFNQ